MSATERAFRAGIWMTADSCAVASAWLSTGVEEVVPGGRNLSMQFNIEDGQPVGLVRLRKELHVRLLRGPAALEFSITRGVGINLFCLYAISMRVTLL
jgi:hypothetical protein